MLAVVTAGVFINRRTPVILTPSARIQLVGWWETTVFLANLVIFILVGLSLNGIVRASLVHHDWRQLLLVALAVNLAVLAVRFGWLAIQASLLRCHGAVAPEDETWKHLIVIAASGFRGAVSLAAALAIPLATRNGTPFPERDLIVFACFSVIVVTLVGGGLSLPALIRVLHLRSDDTEQQELRRALVAAYEAALRRLAALERERRVDPELARELRERYAKHRERAAADDPGEEREALERYAVERELIDAQREALVEQRGRGEIENKVLRRLELTLDMAETELERRIGDPYDITEAESELDTSPPETHLPSPRKP